MLRERADTVNMNNMNNTDTNTEAIIQGAEAFVTFCANHPEIQAAAGALREETFAIFMNNNSQRFVREFIRSIR